MNIALIGYGKMGQAIGEIAVQRGHEVVLTIDMHNAADFNYTNLAKVDVAIEFTGPHSALDNVMKCLDYNVPVVCGSTGWLKDYKIATDFCKAKNGSMVYASNFSVGVNLFFELNKKLAMLMAPHPEYRISLGETHHTQKKDSPSGTAVSLAEQVIAANKLKKSWVNKPSDRPEELEILSDRIDPAPGTHTVKYHSEIDDIEIIHTAHNRTGFATGAVLAAEYIKKNKGIFGMKEVLGL